MATTEEILKAANDLGKLVKDHKAIVGMRDAAEKLRADVDAQRALADFERFVQTIGEKERNSQPIEVEDKHKLESLQKAVINNATLRTFQLAQIEMLDLRRKIDEAVFGSLIPAEAQSTGEAESPLVNPDLS